MKNSRRTCAPIIIYLVCTSTCDGLQKIRRNDDDAITFVGPGMHEDGTLQRTQRQRACACVCARRERRAERKNGVCVSFPEISTEFAGTSVILVSKTSYYPWTSARSARDIIAKKLALPSAREGSVAKITDSILLQPVWCVCGTPLVPLSASDRI